MCWALYLGSVNKRNMLFFTLMELYSTVREMIAHNNYLTTTVNYNSVRICNRVAYPFWECSDG